MNHNKATEEVSKDHTKGETIQVVDKNQLTMYQPTTSEVRLPERYLSEYTREITPFKLRAPV